MKHKKALLLDEGLLKAPEKIEVCDVLYRPRGSCWAADRAGRVDDFFKGLNFFIIFNRSRRANQLITADHLGTCVNTIIAQKTAVG